MNTRHSNIQHQLHGDVTMQ